MADQGLSFRFSNWDKSLDLCKRNCHICLACRQNLSKQSNYNRVNILKTINSTWNIEPTAIFGGILDKNSWRSWKIKYEYLKYKMYSKLK